MSSGVDGCLLQCHTLIAATCGAEVCSVNFEVLHLQHVTVSKYRVLSVYDQGSGVLKGHVS